jgi:hypothetical protein
MLQINSLINNVPVYQNTDTVVPTYKNNQGYTDLNAWANITQQLLKVTVSPRSPLQVYKTSKYALRVLPGNINSVDINNLKENGLIAPFDIFNSFKVLSFYLLQATGNIVIQLELMDLKSVASVFHLLSLPSSTLYLKDGNQVSSIDIAYLTTLGDLTNKSIIVDWSVYISDAAYQILHNLLITTEPYPIRRFNKPIPGKYITGYIRYGTQMYSQVVNLDNLSHSYSQTDEYVYLLGDIYGN